MLAFGWIEDVAAQRRPQLLPKELGKRSLPPAAPAGPAAVIPAPAVSTEAFSAGDDVR